MKELKGTCNEGCQKEFTVKFETIHLYNGIEKTFFTCPECNKEYICYYTDPEIRRLQGDIRKVDRLLGLMTLMTGKTIVVKQHAKLRTEITTKMKALRIRVEQ